MSATTQSPTTFNDDYSGTKQTFTYNPFDVSPDICPLTVSCTDISSGGGPSTLLCSNYELDESNAVDLQFTLDDYSSGDIVPGTYTFTYSVTTGSPDAPLTKTFTFDFILSDACETSVITIPTITDQSYTISDVTQSFNFETDFLNPFSVVPAFCETTLTLTTSAVPLSTSTSDTTQFVSHVDDLLLALEVDNEA